MVDPVESAREAARDEGHLLTEVSVQALDSLASLPASDLATPEFGKPEYLLNCDTNGSPVSATPQLLERLAAQETSGIPWINY